MKRGAAAELDAALDGERPLPPSGCVPIFVLAIAALVVAVLVSLRL